MGGRVALCATGPPPPKETGRLCAEVSLFPRENGTLSAPHVPPILPKNGTVRDTYSTVHPGRIHREAYTPGVPTREAMGGIYSIIHTQGGMVGGIYPCNTPREAWWVYTPYVHTREAMQGGIPYYTHQGGYAGRYTLLYTTLGIHPGIHHLPPYTPWVYLCPAVHVRPSSGC